MPDGDELLEAARIPFFSFLEAGIIISKSIVIAVVQGARCMTYSSGDTVLISMIPLPGAMVKASLLFALTMLRRCKDKSSTAGSEEGLT